MTIEDVEWLLRYDADELTMSADTLNMLTSALSGSPWQKPSGGVVYGSRMDDTGRMVRFPTSLSGRTLMIDDLTPGCIRLRRAGRDLAAVCFVTS